MLTSVFSEELSGMAILDLKYRGTEHFVSKSLMCLMRIDWTKNE